MGDANPSDVITIKTNKAVKADGSEAGDCNSLCSSSSSSVRSYKMSDYGRPIPVGGEEEKEEEEETKVKKVEAGQEPAKKTEGPKADDDNCLKCPICSKRYQVGFVL